MLTKEFRSGNKVSSTKKEMSYAKAGVDRVARDKIRVNLLDILKKKQRGSNQFGKPVELPFGQIFPVSSQAESFYDLQIEGIGTKTLLAELYPSKGYSQIGIDGVAMVVNDIIRSGANPLLLADALHIARSDQEAVSSILNGIIEGAKISGCVIASGETGDVSEVLHGRISSAAWEPFDLMVSCLGIVRKENVIRGKIKEDDIVIGIESSGIHSNGITLARKILLKRWGGKYEAMDEPETLARPIIEELLEPTRIYVKEVVEASRALELKSAVHITGDGFAKFQRLLDYQSSPGARFLGIDFDLPTEQPPIFTLIENTAKDLGKRLSRSEMFRTFNMGFGFAVLINSAQEEDVLDLFNKYHPSKRIGRVTKSGKITISSQKDRRQKLVIT